MTDTPLTAEERKVIVERLAEILGCPVDKCGRCRDLAREELVPVIGRLLNDLEAARSELRKADGRLVAAGRMAWPGMFMRIEELERENAALLRERTRIEQCPLCGSTDNCLEAGGNQNCFHCVCGYLQCSPPDFPLEKEEEA